MSLLSLLCGSALAATPLDHNPYVTYASDSTIQHVVGDAKRPTIVLYAPSCEKFKGNKVIERKMDLTLRAFGISATRFKDEIQHGQVQFVYFDSEFCLTDGHDMDWLDRHNTLEHGLEGFPTFVLYGGNMDAPLSLREITRLEKGVDKRKNLAGFINGLSFLVTHDLILRDTIYEFTDNGTLQPIDPNTIKETN
ncbi:hypothetical protein EXS74_00490 [Candidatus Woesearchaeota archaeon]|nr:hypothetical protein [Candidatus Woesearchaeota archaeon]